MSFSLATPVALICSEQNISPLCFDWRDVAFACLNHCVQFL